MKSLGEEGCCFIKIIIFAFVMERVALFAGSFDPFTRGHEALVEESLRLFDKVVIGVGANISKQGLLSVEQRLRLIEDLYSTEPRVEVRSYTTLTADFAREVGATALVRGVRNTIDFEFERSIEMTNRHLAPELTTILLVAPAEYGHISSSVVRELLAFGHSVAEFMPEGIEIEKYITK